MDRRTIFIAFAAAAVLAAPSSAAAMTIGEAAPPSTPGGCGNCNAVQVSIASGTNPYIVPFKGIVTGFTSRIGDTVAPGDWFQYGLLTHVASESFILKSTTDHLALPAAAAGSLYTFKVHIPVSGGEYLMVNSSASAQTWSPAVFNASNATKSFASYPDVGVNTSLNAGPAMQGYRLNVAARFEFDGDGDGYGDETEDLCPGNAARQTECTPPVASAFASKYAKFRVNPKGAIAAKATPKGTKFSLTLSEASTVSLLVESATTKRGKTTYKRVHGQTKSLPAGAASWSYSGRYLDSKKRKKSLRPGKYRITATPTDAAGNVGAPAATTFKVVK